MNAPVESRAPLNIPRSLLIAVAAGGTAIIVLLALVLVVLTSTRDRSVSLDHKSSVLISDLATVLQAAEPALSAAQPTLAALPQNARAARQRAGDAVQLSAETRRYLGELRAAGLPASLVPLTKLPAALVPLTSLAGTIEAQNRVPSLVTELSQLSASVNGDGLVANASALFAQTPAVLSTLGQLRGLLTQLHSSHFVAVATSDLGRIPAIERLLSRSLRTQLTTSSSTQKVATAVQSLVPIAQTILSIGGQTLAHVTSLDKKVGVVP